MLKQQQAMPFYAEQNVAELTSCQGSRQERLGQKTYRL